MALSSSNIGVEYFNEYLAKEVPQAIKRVFQRYSSTTGENKMTEQLLQHITPHVWWMPPGKPDRPSLCAIVGERTCVMLDSGASDAHARLFMEGLKAKNLPMPHFLVLSHWHWDHTFGAAEIGASIIAHPKTAQKIEEMARYSWDDEAMAERVAAGLGIPTPGGMRDIQEEVPEIPRKIRFMLPDLIVDTSLTIDLGGVTCRIEHVGGDHAADSCVIHVVEDRVLFLGDAMYPAISPTYYYTAQKMPSLMKTLLSYEAEHFIEGHRPNVMERPELTGISEMAHVAARLVQAMPDADAAAIMGAAAAEGITVSDEEEFDFIVNAMITGRDF
jgi:glyoxylase-like metal-dependent hydrolase (beta-lactamase superfamily II)